MVYLKIYIYYFSSFSCIRWLRPFILKHMKAEMEILWIFIATICPYQHGFLSGLRRFEFITGWFILSRRLKGLGAAKSALGARATQHRWESTRIFFGSRVGDVPSSGQGLPPVMSQLSLSAFHPSHLPVKVWWPVCVFKVIISSGSEAVYTCGVQARFLTALTFCAQKWFYTDCMAGSRDISYSK